MATPRFYCSEQFTVSSVRYKIWKIKIFFKTMSFFFEEQSPFFPTLKEIIHIPTFPFSFKTKEMKVWRGGYQVFLLESVR